MSTITSVKIETIGRHEMTLKTWSPGTCYFIIVHETTGSKFGIQVRIEDLQKAVEQVANG